MLSQIEVDIKTALLAGDSLDVEVLKSLKNSIIIFGKDQGHDATNDEAVKIVQKEIKKRVEAAKIYAKAEAVERAEKETKEAKILEKYLPEQLSQEEIEVIVDKVITENGIDSPQKMGMAIGLASKEIGGQANGAQVAAVVKKKLGV